MFPKHSAQAPRGSERLGWLTYWLLNAGLLFRAVGEPARGVGARTDWLLLAAACLQLAAGVAFVLNTWPRVKER
jgi:hypothetical protein